MSNGFHFGPDDGTELDIDFVPVRPNTETGPMPMVWVNHGKASSNKTTFRLIPPPPMIDPTGRMYWWEDENGGEWGMTKRHFWRHGWREDLLK